VCCQKQPRARTSSCKEFYYAAQSCGGTPKGHSVVFSLQSSRCPHQTPEASFHNGSHILMASRQETVAAARVFGMRRQCDGAALCSTEQHVVMSATQSPRMSFHHSAKQRPPLHRRVHACAWYVLRCPLWMPTCGQAVAPPSRFWRHWPPCLL